jgi:mRNA interferase MazF
LIVSIDAFNQNSRSAIAFAVTSQQPKVKYSLVYQLPKDLLPKPSWVKITQIRTLSTNRIENYIASISDRDFNKVMSAFERLCGR